MRTHYTSDHHLHHGMVAGLRGFESKEEHNAVLLENHNKVVGKRDSVWFLGDFTLGPIEGCVGWLAMANGRKHLVLGNHDQGFPTHKGWHRKLRRYYEAGFESVSMQGARDVGGIKVLLSHFPYRDDRGDPRYTQWRLPDHGQWLLHGHTHKADQQFHDHHEIHVGLDAWGFSPVSVDTIFDIMRAHS